MSQMPVQEKKTPWLLLGASHNHWLDDADARDRRDYLSIFG
jgi:hypothetical protein